MTTGLSSSDLRAKLARPGLLAFPLTDFDADGAFAPAPFEERVAWMQSKAPSALFIAGGAGELFSLDADEQEQVLCAALSVRRGGIPFLAAAGRGTREAIAAVRMAERLGADGILLLPHYLTEAPQAGIAAHIKAVCDATGLGVIIYGRANARIGAEALARLCDACPNLIGYKDGIGDTEELWAMRTRLSGRLAFFNGMPTAEVYASAYTGMGVPTYSSAILNFVPDFARTFFNAVQARDLPAIDRMMAEFFVPYGRIRSRQPGYAVSIVKAGVALVGRPAGPVRPPLTELTTQERQDLERLIFKVEPQSAVAAAAS